MVEASARAARSATGWPTPQSWPPAVSCAASSNDASADSPTSDQLDRRPLYIGRVTHRIKLAVLDRTRKAPMDEPLNPRSSRAPTTSSQAAAVLAAGAAALGKPVTSSSSTGRSTPSAPTGSTRPWLAPEAGAAGRTAVDALKAPARPSGPRRLRQAKELGEVDIQACSLSMDLLHLDEPILIRWSMVWRASPPSISTRATARSLHLRRRTGSDGEMHHGDRHQYRRCRGLSCPMPIVKTAQAIKTLASGALSRSWPPTPVRPRTSPPGPGPPATRSSSRPRAASIASSSARSEDAPMTVTTSPTQSTSCCHDTPLPARRSRPAEGGQERLCSSIAYSGELEKVWATMILASTAAAMGVTLQSSSPSGACRPS